MKREAAIPRERKEKQLSCPPVFRLHCRPARSLLSPLAADAACRGREGDPGRPQGGRSARAGADIAPATGRGRFAPMPHATRGRRGTAQLKRQLSSYRQAGSTGCRGGECFLFKRKHSDGCGSRRPRPSTRKNRAFSAVRGQRHIRSRGGAAAPLTPCPAPGRRPTARAGQQPQAKEEEGRQKEKLFAGQQPQCTEGHPLNTPGHFNFEKETHRQSRWFFICACKALLPAAP